MKKLNLKGMTFNRWHVIEEGEKSKCGHTKWWCWCDCEKDLPYEDRHLHLVYGSSLKNNRSLSCGCLTKENAYMTNKKYNKYEEKEDYYIGTTYSGDIFYIDKDDFNIASKYSWNVNSRGYLTTTDNDSNFYTLHRLIMNITDPCIQVDHINHNKLDNRKCNLRLCNNSENQHNRGLSQNNTSGVTGVSWHKRDQVWMSYITFNNKRIYLGRFKECDFDEAVRVRKEAEIKYFGNNSINNTNNL